MNKEDIKNQENNDLIKIADQSGVETAIETLINKNASLLPKDVATQRIVNSAGFYISHRKDLMDLGRDGKLDMLYGVLKEAMVGCEAGTDFDIIPFKGKPVISRKKEGWYKIIDLIKPAEIIRFTNNVIFRGDEYSFNPVTEELTHIPKVTEKTIFMTKKDLDAIKRVSPSANSTYSPWVSMPVKMVKTKVVKELAKELNTLFGGRVNHALSQAVESDEISVKEVDVNGNIENDKEIYDTKSDEIIPEQETPQEKKTDENNQVEITLDDVK